MVPGALCLSVSCSPLHGGGARSQGLSRSGAADRPPLLSSGAGGAGRSRQDAGIPEIPVFRERTAPALGALPAPRKLHIEAAAGAVPLTVSCRRLAPPRRRRGGE